MSELTTMHILTALDTLGMETFILGLGLPKYRVRQVQRWIYTRGCGDFGRMSDLSKEARRTLADQSQIRSIKPVDVRTSSDGTEKYLFRLADGESVESVLMFEPGRATLCVSSQVGCAMGCRFCRTASLGFRRNLEAHEIVEQALYARGRLLPDSDITNIVLMGMGEPFENFGNVREALFRLTSPDYVGLSKRHVTVSTSGNADGIRSLGQTGPDVNLAVSLNATTDEVRSEIMPINRKFPISELMRACREFPLKPYRRITFEYVMLRGVNDTEADARRLIGLIKGLPSKVNLIPFNPFPGARFERPVDADVERFQSILAAGGVSAPIRKSKGRDIAAACGQLKAEKDMPPMS
ncbi:MAG: 23S rRNA (adenine(2503)-C(2))-methyltransferase RlmN [Nitrospirae bacterium]|nr:23S rRNA (adenine(2503)-C(2))-methyltransferase RlmN [Nitrospirota bacterium]